MPDPTLRDRIAETIWTASRADEGTVSATGANIVADALLPLIEQHCDERAAEAERERDLHKASLADAMQEARKAYDRAERAEATLREVRALAAVWTKGLDVDDVHPMDATRRLLADLRAVLDREGGEPC